MLNQKLKDKVRQYIQDRAEARLKKFDKEAEALREKVQHDSVELDKLNADLLQKRIEEERRFKPSVWLTDAAMRAKQISLVTHALKFTHTDAKGSSIYAQPEANRENSKQLYLCTSSLTHVLIDVVGNAAALDVASLLQLEEEGVSLIDRIVQNDNTALAPFSENPEQLNEWLEGFKAALDSKELASHRLAKQLYFPVSTDQYHLLSPLYASSLSHRLYRRIADTRYTEESKAARKARREEKYSAYEAVDYLATAIQTFGGTKPQNVSQLNSSRSGKSFLLSCRPPVWNKQVEPPQSSRAFWRGYERRVWKIVKELRAFLVSILDKTSTKPRRAIRAEGVDELIFNLMAYAGEIRNTFSIRAGWSLATQLTEAERLWLDPRHHDAEFQLLREKKDWHNEIADTFAGWLNHKLREAGLEVKDTEHDEWWKETKQKLALFKEDLELQREDDLEGQIS
ncbi:MAG: type I-F CRISPR-associated protein Csy1 [Pseudomonadota bacterium]